MFPTQQVDLPAAIAFCRQAEAVVAPLGWHVGLSGGCLYKDGLRKDADVILYRHNVKAQYSPEQPRAVVAALAEAGLFTPMPGSRLASTTDKKVFVGQSTIHGFRVDLFFLPEAN